MSLRSVLLTLCVALPSAALTSGLLSCTGRSGPPGVDAQTGEAIDLSTLPFAELQIPEQSRPGGAEPPTRIPVAGPWRYVGTTRKGMHKYATAVPIRPRGLFFNRPQPGMELRTAGGEPVRYDRFGKHNTHTWSYDRKELIVYQPERNPPPADGQFLLSYPKAIDREAKLNLKWSGGQDTEHADKDWNDPRPKEIFAWTSIQDDWDSREGLLLPAPGVAAWELTVPPSGELHFVSGLVEPEIRETQGSDGARLIVEVEASGQITELLSTELAIRSFTPQRVDLSRYAGQAVTLRMRTDPLGTPDFDYAFIAEPVVASRLEDPVRVVMVFIDTLRPDHMSLYGYERDTTSKIDHLGGSAAIFTQARSVAPWTLPSARTLVTGRHPEYYHLTKDGPEQTVQAILGEQGWASAFMAGNVYLSSNFDMEQDWDLHRVGLWPMAEKITDDTLTWLKQHEGRNSIVQVHYMDPHLPYIEPGSYRHLYAGEGYDGLREEFHLSDVRKANLKDKPEVQQYIKDRYDNNIRYATDQLARIVEVLDDNDILMIYADHGEEFWDHGGFEHGHTLFDELLHVPLIVKAPGVSASKIDAPVSLLDVTPTILDLLGQPLPEGLDGQSLAPLLRGEAGAAERFAKRDLAFGRPLYGMERWGVLHDQMKWSTTEGREALYDLRKDPRERSNLLIEDPDDSGSNYRTFLGDALGRDVGAGYRLNVSRSAGPPTHGTWALCTIPRGFKAAWPGDDPTASSEVTVNVHTDPEVIQERLDAYQIQGHELPGDLAELSPEVGKAVEVCWHPHHYGSREIYLIPEGSMAEDGPKMVCSAYQGDASGGDRATFTIAEHREPTLGKLRIPLRKVQFKQRRLVLQFGIGPIPNARTQALSGQDDEMSGGLAAMGYVIADPTDVSGSCEPPAIELPDRREATATPPK